MPEPNGRIITKHCGEFVSHAMPQVARVANNILLMDSGKPLLHTNDVSKGIQVYYSQFVEDYGGSIRSGNEKVELLIFI